MTDLPLVLLHGYPLDRTIWRNQMSIDASPVIAPDFPGFGNSPITPLTSMNEYADWINDFLLELGHNRAVWVGHSMGGYVALALARRHTNSVRALVLVCTQARSDTEEARQNRLSVASRVMREGTEAITGGMGAKLVSANHAEKRESLIRELENLMRSTEPAAIAQAQRAMAVRQDQRSTLPSLSMPVLIVYGAEDQFLSEDCAIEMADGFPDVRVERFASSGHMAMMEEPERFNAVLSQFVSSLA